MAAYFGRPDNKNHSQVSMFTEVPNNFYEQPLAMPRDYRPAESRSCCAPILDFISGREPADGRSTKLFLSGMPAAYPNLAAHFLDMNLPLDELKARLDGCSPNEALDMLTANNPDGEPGPWSALYDGYSIAIGSYFNLVSYAREKGLITDTQVFDLLAAISPGTPDNPGTSPGRMMAMRNDKAEAIKAQNKAIIHAMEKGWIDKEKFLSLVAAIDDLGCSGRYHARQSGSDAAIRADAELIEYALGKKWIDRRDANALLGRDTNALPGSDNGS